MDMKRWPAAGRVLVFSALIAGAPMTVALAQTSQSPASQPPASQGQSAQGQNATQNTGPGSPQNPGQTAPQGSGRTSAESPPQNALNGQGGAVANAVQNGAKGPGDAVQTPPDSVYSAMFKALFSVFVLAVVLESALAVVFNWRPFLMYFDGRGVRTLIMLAFAWSIVQLLKIDLVAQLNAATTGVSDQPRTVVGTLLTALVVAGGSAGVNNILKSLGFRDLTRAEEVAPKPPHDKAWLAVSLRRKTVQGPARVLVQRGVNPPELVGMIGRGSAPARALRWFVRDPTRFPMSGGYAVDGGDSYALRVEGEGPDAVTALATWGPFPIAKGAVIDIELEL